MTHVKVGMAKFHNALIQKIVNLKVFSGALEFFLNVAELLVNLANSGNPINP